MQRALAILLMLAIVGAMKTHAQNWPGFRGADNGVAADDPVLPDRWSTTENVAWKSTSRAAAGAHRLSGAITSSS
jgi:hypothetical protein